MKQYITPEDIEQLSEKGQLKYLEAFADGMIGNISGRIIHPLANIGMMIEFLGRNTTGYICLPTGHDGDILTEDFCDDLWEVVKEELNEQ